MYVAKRVSWQQRQQLVEKAIRAACSAREQAGCDDESPICAYDICEQLGVTVRFVDINMEGMFRRGQTPGIAVSALRPLPRQAFTCAHELGHYWLGHGSTIDELKIISEQYDGRPPEEILADGFASALLMPAIGIRYALAMRDAEGGHLLPETAYTIACDFGVGYDTLISHLQWNLREISEETAKQLRLTTPQDIREKILGNTHKQHMLMVDAYCQAETMDTLVGSHVIAPQGSKGNSKGLHPVACHNGREVFQVTQQGGFELEIFGRDAPLMIRGTRPNTPDDGKEAKYFVGLARFRHLEEEGNDV